MAVDFTSFNRHMSDESRLALILRGHLYVEIMLTDLIKSNLKKPKMLNLERMGFRQKIDLAGAIGCINDGEIRSLLLLNGIRNRQAHDLGDDLDDAELDSLCTSIAGRVKVVFDAVVASTGDYSSTKANKTALFFFAWVQVLDYRRRLVEWEQENHDKLAAFYGVKAATDLVGKPITDEEAAEEVGLPPRPDPRHTWELRSHLDGS